jgi:hypothetical protein
VIYVCVCFPLSWILQLRATVGVIYSHRTSRCTCICFRLPTEFRSEAYRSWHFHTRSTYLIPEQSTTSTWSRLRQVQARGVFTTLHYMYTSHNVHPCAPMHIIVRRHLTSGLGLGLLDDRRYMYITCISHLVNTMHVYVYGNDAEVLIVLCY